MKSGCNKNLGINKLLRRYREIFRVPENLNHYSPEDYKLAEKKFLKQALMGRMPPAEPGLKES
jgi:hypothetical protein